MPRKRQAQRRRGRLPAKYIGIVDAIRGTRGNARPAQILDALHKAIDAEEARAR